MSDYDETLERAIRRYGADSPEVKRLRAAPPILEHPYPIGLRVRNYGQQYPEAVTGTATIVDNTVKARSGAQEYVVLRDEAVHGEQQGQWPGSGTIPAVFPADESHLIEPLQPGDNAGCSCGFVGGETLAAAHARAYGICGTCWGSGTDSYPSLGTCEFCGGSGTFEDEATGLAAMAAAYAEIDGLDA